MATTEEMRRRLRHLSYWMLPAMAFGVVSNILSLMGVDSEPWLWTRTIIMAVAVTILCVQLTRFTLWQRDEYWRERGKDPKHPERPASLDDP